MKYSLSILNIKNNISKISQIDGLKSDFIHIDIMDGIFVDNQTSFSSLEELQTPLDIHLMVDDIKLYIDNYSNLKPEYITFHIEATEDPEEIIKYVKEKHSKVGISIKPDTDIKKIFPYLQDIDLVLVMSVNPGYGNQTFIEKTIDKVNLLKKIKETENLFYKIEVDGGINLETCTKCENADILVIGSYITDSMDIQQSFQNIKQKFI